MLPPKKMKESWLVQVRATAGVSTFAHKLAVNITISKLWVLSKCTAADYKFDL